MCIFQCTWGGKVLIARTNRLHTLTPEELQSARLAPYLRSAEQELDAKLQATQQGNERVMQEIVAERAKIEQLVLGLETVINDLEGSVKAMNSGTGGDVDGLRKEMWEMEDEVKMVS